MQSDRAWGLAPILRVRDVRAAVAYYREKLGFECPEESIAEGLGDEGAIYAIARRQGAAIHLGRARSDWEIDPGRLPNALGAYVYVPDVERVFEELSERGADVVQEPRTAPWGFREVIVRDLDGYHLTFGSPATG
jgi:uncharacterized glyoxalase superfamily protein PhnB